MRSLAEEAKHLAQAHRKADPETKVIKFFPPAENNKEIRLLEVSTLAPTTGEVLPFSFSSDPQNGVDYRSTVILLSPEEWRQVQGGELDLPTGWEIDVAEDL